MGLGKLNPGWNNCGCVVVPRPTDPCKYSLFVLKPIKATIESPVVFADNGRTLPIFGFPDGPAVFAPNAGQVVTLFKTFDDEQAFCTADMTDNFGLSQQPSGSSGYPSSHWLFSSIGDCQFALENDNAGRMFSQQLPVGYFRARVTFDYVPGQQWPFVEVELWQAVRVSQHNSSDSDEYFPNDCPIDYPMFSGQVSPQANYYGGGDSNSFFASEKLPPVNQLVGSVHVYKNYVNPFTGCSYFDYEGACWVSRTLERRTKFKFYPQNPVGGEQREFYLWQPDVPIDPWGLMNQEVKLTLELGL